MITFYSIRDNAAVADMGVKPFCVYKDVNHGAIISADVGVGRCNGRVCQRRCFLHKGCEKGRCPGGFAASQFCVDISSDDELGIGGHAIKNQLEMLGEGFMWDVMTGMVN